MADLSLDDELLMLAAESPPEEGEALSDADSNSPSPSRSPSRSRSRSRTPRFSRSRTPRSRHSASPAHSGAGNSQSDRHQSPRGTPERKMSRGRSSERQKRDGSVEDGEASGAESVGSAAMDESDSDNDSDAGDRDIPGETAFAREQRLAEQAEREEERQKKAKLQALVNERNRLDARSGKRKADDLDDDAYDRRSSRRPKKEPESSRRPAKRTQRKYSSSSSPRAAAKVDDGLEPGTLQQYNRVRVGRSNWPQVCFTPGFEEVFTGAYARVCSAQDTVTGQNTYRMCQIKGFKTGKPYRMDDIPDSRVKHIFCDTYLIASYGSMDREYPFVACSDTGFTEEEFQRRNQMLESQNLEPSTQAFLFKKCSAINAFLAKTLTAAEISEKVARRNKYLHLLASSEPGFGVGPKTLERNLALERVNEQNRLHNQKTVRAAELARINERRRLQKQAAKARMEREEKERKAKEAAERGETVEEEKVEKPKAISAYVPRDYKSAKDFSKLRTDDEIVRSLDVQVDIDIDI